MLINTMKTIRVAFVLAIVAAGGAVCHQSPRPESPDPQKSQAAAAPHTLMKVRAVDGTPLPPRPAQPIGSLAGDTSYEQCVAICEGLADGCRITGMRPNYCASLYASCARRCATKYGR